MPVRGGEIVVLGPGGAPRRVPVWFAGSTLRGRFALDRPGAFTVQVMADTQGGPRPVLEACVFAGRRAPPRTRAIHGRARGEPATDAGDGAQDDDARLTTMLAGARASAGLRPLQRDPRLDAIARRHATQMATTPEPRARRG